MGGKPHGCGKNYDVFAEVKAQVDLCTVIEVYTGQRLQRRGSSAKGLCPFHMEKTPSFVVNTEKGYYHCFGCGAHGTVIDFAMAMFSLSPLDAARKLAEDFAVPIPDQQSLSPEERQRIKKEQAERKRQRARNDALRTWSDAAWKELAALRRYCFLSLRSAQDYHEHPEYVHYMQYADYILDLLESDDAGRKTVLNAKIRGDLGFVGSFVPGPETETASKDGGV